MPGFPVLHYLLEFTKIHVNESVMLSNHLILCCPLLLLPSMFPSLRIFSSEWAICIMWPKYWSFSFSISPSNEYSGLISIRINWSNLFAVPGTFKSLLQHHSSKTSILWCSAFFVRAQPALTSVYDYWNNHSFDYMDLGVTTGCLGCQLKKIQYKKMQSKS